MAESERILVCLNFGNTEQPISAQDFAGAIILASTHPGRASLDARLVLRPDEGLTVLMAL
jgi:hypothetical protein